MRTNTQFTVENRRNWKGQVVDYDAIQAYKNRECLYCLTDAQIAVLGGIIEPLAWATRWQSDTQPIDETWIRQFRDDIQRRLMMSCCGDEILFRYDEDGNLESSEDGGTTYTPDPQDDIRINPKIVFPPPIPVEGEDNKCIPADGAVKLIKEQIGDQLTDDMSRYTLQQLITDWTNTVVGTSNPFQALAVVITNQIFALLISALRPALTDTVYETLRCILRKRMNDVAFFDGAAWELVRSDILSQISGIAGIFLEHLIYLIGNGGLSNLARAGAGASDANCDECGCICSTADWVVPASVVGTIDTATRTSCFVRVFAALNTDGKYYAIFQAPTDMDCCTAKTTPDSSGNLNIESGSPNLSFYNPCGEPLSNVPSGMLSLGFAEVSLNAWFYRGDAPFTITWATSE